MKFLKFLLLLCSILLLVSSCSHVEKLEIFSNDYEGLSSLTAGTLNEDTVKFWSSPDVPYDVRNGYVSITKEGVTLSRDDNSYSSSVMQMNNGYFLGVNLGMDGWVRYFPYFSTYPEAGESKLVAPEPCCFFIQADRWNGYVCTLAVDEEVNPIGKIYQLKYLEDGEQWDWKWIATVQGSPLAFFSEEQSSCIYIVTDENISVMSNEHTVSVLTESDLLKKIRANSIVVMNQTVYCGSPMGVYRYNLQNQLETWFPIDPEKYYQRVYS